MAHTPLKSLEAPGESGSAQHRRRVGAVTAPALLRSIFLVGLLLSLAVAGWAGDPAGYFEADPALATLLRGMALIKGLVLLATVPVLLWRFGRRVTAAVALGYCVSAWAMTAATVFIWQLTRIPLDAVVFHAALIGMLLTAWRDDNKGLRVRRFETL